MFIPIVRRTITVRVRETFRFPFQCEVCRLATWATAFAEGIGSATMAYISPDENVARQRARQAAYGMATATFSQSPCPRCGGHSARQRSSLVAWEQKATSRKRVRFWLLIVGLALTFVWASGCGIWMAVDGGSDMVAPAAMSAIVWFFLGAGATAIAYAVAGPGTRPQLLSYIPSNIVFDPPDPALVQGDYRTA